jgi:hypothetical protein
MLEWISIFPKDLQQLIYMYIGTQVVQKLQWDSILLVASLHVNSRSKDVHCNCNCYFCGVNNLGRRVCFWFDSEEELNLFRY